LSVIPDVREDFQGEFPLSTVIGVPKNEQFRDSSTTGSTAEVVVICFAAALGMGPILALG
jgi:hypothetical protein